jgi:predicted nucleotidyltransferase component of viral defense system
MNLHENSTLFEQTIQKTADQTGINPAILEKDYHVTRLLQNIFAAEPEIIFRGGTSLSKCYRLINRFSEDIDLGTDNNKSHMTEGMRKKLSAVILSAGNELGYTLINSENIRNRRDFNQYIYEFDSKYSFNKVHSSVIIETAVGIPSFPSEKMQADSYIGHFLMENGYEDLVKKYEMEPFYVNVQTKERTFVDKIFAICDYYLEDMIQEHSRHLYDLYKLFPTLTIDANLNNLINQVRELRSNNKMCLSAQQSCDINEILEEIIQTDVYKNDYNNITSDLLFEQVSYEQALFCLQKIKNSGIMNN